MPMGATIVLDRRPRHERQAQGRRHAERALSAGPAGRLARRRQGARDPADHRSLCRASRRARLVRDRLSAGRHATRPAIIARIAALPGIELALDRTAAASKFELPDDRIGDIIVVSERNTAIGSAAKKHDLSGLTAPLRSHGGMTEQKVPVIVNRPIKALPAGYRLRNFNAFDLALNYAVAQGTAEQGRLGDRHGRQVRREHMRVADAVRGPASARSRSTTPTPTRSAAPCRRRASPMSRRPSASPTPIEPELSRSERSEILRKTADLLVARKQEIAELITAESGLCLKDTLYEVGRAYDVFFLSSDRGHQGRRRDLLLRHHPARQEAQDLHPARAAAGRHHRDHAVQPPAEPGGAQGRAVDRHQQPHGAEAVGEDAADGACCWPTSSTRPACRRRCSRW